MASIQAPRGSMVRSCQSRKASSYGAKRLNMGQLTVISSDHIPSPPMSSCTLQAMRFLPREEMLSLAELERR